MPDVPMSALPLTADAAGRGLPGPVMTHSGSLASKSDCCLVGLSQLIGGRLHHVGQQSERPMAGLSCHVPNLLGPTACRRARPSDSGRASGRPPSRAVATPTASSASSCRFGQGRQPSHCLNIGGRTPQKAGGEPGATLAGSRLLSFTCMIGTLQPLYAPTQCGH